MTEAVQKRLWDDPVHVNLTEMDGWRKWDPSYSDTAWASDSSWEDFRRMEEGDLEGLIDDIWESPAKGLRKPKQRLNSSELSYLARLLQDQEEILEPVQRAIVDAGQWMYELAAIPTDDDIRGAMDTAAELFELPGDMAWQYILMPEIKPGPKGWIPRHGRVTERELLKQLLETISFHHEKDEWDRFVTFDFYKAPAVQMLLKKDPPAKDEIEIDFKIMRGNYIENLFTDLTKSMGYSDLNNRTNWKKNWKSMLSDPSVVKEARTAIRKALSGMPEEADES